MWKEFWKGYLQAMAFTAHRETVDANGDYDSNPLFEDKQFSEFDIKRIHEVLSVETILDLQEDCVQFLVQVQELYAESFEEFDIPWEQVGSDFHLSRNGHGAGFFDRDYQGLENQLQEMARVWGTCELVCEDQTYQIRN